MIRVGWYRSVNNIQHAFAMNCFTHEVAEAAGRDHLDLLLEMIGEAEGMDLAADGVKEYWNYGDSIEDVADHAQPAVERSSDRRGKVGLRQDATQGARARPCGSPRLPQLRGERRARGRPRRRDLPHPTGGHGHRLRPLREPGRRAQAARGARPSTATPSRASARSRQLRARWSRATSTTTRSRASTMRLSMCGCTIVEDFVHLRPCGVGEPGGAAVHAGAGQRDLQRHRQADPDPADRRSAQIRVVQLNGGRGLERPCRLMQGNTLTGSSARCPSGERFGLRRHSILDAEPDDALDVRERRCTFRLRVVADSGLECGR